MATTTTSARIAALETKLDLLIETLADRISPDSATPRKSRKARTEKPRTFASRADLEAGKGFPCTADEPCSRQLRTPSRAASHGVEGGGHDPR